LPIIGGTWEIGEKLGRTELKSRRLVQKREKEGQPGRVLKPGRERLAAGMRAGKMGGSGQLWGGMLDKRDTSGNEG